MKKRVFKPGFEFIFSLCMFTVLGLPPLVFAQTIKDMQITINNGDTVINGKNIKDLSASDRKDALKNINQIATINSDDKGSMRQPPMASNDDRHIKILRSTHGKDTTVMLNYSMDNMPKHKMEKREMRMTRDDDNSHGIWAP